MERQVAEVAVGKPWEPDRRGSQSGVGGKQWDREHRATGANIILGFARAVYRHCDRSHLQVSSVPSLWAPRTAQWREEVGGSPTETSPSLLSNLRFFQLKLLPVEELL